MRREFLLKELVEDYGLSIKEAFEEYLADSYEAAGADYEYLADEY